MSEELNTEQSSRRQKPTTPEGTVTLTTPQNYTVTVPQQIDQEVQQFAKKSTDKKDPRKFDKEGVVFNAKLIGVDDVPEARGDRMCQEKISHLKAIVKASGDHKLKIIVNVSMEGIKLIDLRTGIVIHSHPVHKISFISRDITDRRAFGYIFGAEDKSHKFFGIKTEKAAEALVLTLRDLFQVVYEKKKREMEVAKKEQDTQAAHQEERDINVVNLDGELNTESSTDEEPVSTVPHNNKSVTQSDILDLQSELVSIEKGIEQMNTLESLFEENPATTSCATATNDPWGTPTMASENLDARSGDADIKDIDLFGDNAVQPKKKEDIMSLFMPASEEHQFGAPRPTSQHTYRSDPRYAAHTGPFQAGFPQLNPFGAQSTSDQNHYQGNTISMQPSHVGRPFGTLDSRFGDTFGRAPTGLPQNISHFDEPVLAPTVVQDPYLAPPKTEVKSKADAFADLVDIGNRDKTNKSPKDLFAEARTTPKKSMNEMRAQTVDSGQVTRQHAADPFDPFGAFLSTPQQAMVEKMYKGT